MTTDTQPQLMAFDPASGEPRPYPSHAGQWREYHGTVAWLFNPWTGTRRLAADVGTDSLGRLVQPSTAIGSISAGKVLSRDAWQKLMSINTDGLQQRQQGAAEQGWDGVIRNCNPGIVGGNQLFVEQAVCTCGEGIKRYGICSKEYCRKARNDAASGNAAGAYPNP
jgi:hypothetical protein